MIRAAVERFHALVSNGLDYRARLLVATQFGKANPQPGDEPEEEYMWRVHWAVLTTLGLPPIFVVRQWLQEGDAAKVGMIPPAQMIERYLATRGGVPLPDGKADQRIVNGQGVDLLTLSRRLGVNVELRPGRYWLDGTQ